MAKPGPKPRPFEDRMKENIVVDPKTGCWIWTGVKIKDGYGRLGFNGKKVYAHRLAYGSHI